MPDDPQASNYDSNGREAPALKDEDERPASLLRNLSDSFSYVRQRRETGKVVTPPACVLPSFLTHVTVNFIDPTSSSITTTTTTSKPVQLYEKFVAIFEQEYGGKLSYVPYQLFRNNSGGVIENLPVRTVVARSHGGGLVISDDTAQSAVHDYSWEQPYCHVYLAACESLEHYRTKVKPSIQAFVSQLDAASKSKRQASFRRRSDSGGSNNDSDSPATTAASSPKTPGKRIKPRILPGPRYVIVYVPTGDRSKVDDISPKKAKGVGASVVSRFSAARQRISAVRGENMPPDSAHSGTMLDSSENNTVTEDEAAMPPSIQKLNKVEREIARRFANDFPSGNVCTLSTLVDGSTGISETGSTDSLDDAVFEQDDSSHFQKLEWNAVLKAMASAITAGFQDRCQRFDDELRKLDQQRRGDTGTKADTEDDSMSKGFHLSNFFLVKESLAFTYEQMRLPAEALLQYEELWAFLPDRETILEGSAKANCGENENLLRMALTGDILEFRGLLRSYGEFAPVIHVAEEYLFAREIALLFQMHKSVRVVQRCLSYVKSTFDLKKSRIDSSVDAEESLQQLVELQKWAFNFCWDVKKACDIYFKGASTKAVVTAAFARSLCDVLEFARLHLESLGEMLLPNNLLRSKRPSLMHVVGPWSPWEEPSPAEESPSEQGDSSTDFLENALSSADAYLSRYLDLTEVIAGCNEFCGRRRYAARLRIERMEMFGTRGDKVKAAKEIRSIVDIYGHDMWNACHFALWFRLAAFQRHIATAKNYLETLVCCFSEAVHEVAPPKALDALYNDLESVVRSKSVEGLIFAAPPLFGPVFGLEGIAAPRALGTDRNLLKRLYTVGDKVRVTLSLQSFLPKDIKVDSIAINLVPFRTYVAAMEDSVPIKSDDICRVLTLTSEVSISSGQNKYTCEWLPKNGGQFIIASVFIAWNGVEFSYTAKEMRRPTIRIDVVPCEPTQTLEVKPNYLVPGHEQPLSFEFSAGTDVVQTGSLQLVGSPGLLFLPPNSENDSDAWVSSFEVCLPPCPPSETICLKALAKVVSPEESSVSIQPVRAKVSTTYKYANEEPGDATTECMETSLDATIPTLGRAALSVLDCDLVPYSVDKAMVNVLLQCNTPAPFKIKNWSITLPRHFILSDIGDMNGSLADEKVASGERISMSFDCSHSDAEDSSGACDPVLRVDLENEMGTMFQEILNLSFRRSLGPRLKPLDMKAVEVKISSSTAEGLVGVPVEFTYSIDSSGLAALSGDVVYMVAVDDAEWIVSGKVAGTVNVAKGSRQQVTVVAIPVQPGRITAYPGISLVRQSTTDSTVLPVKLFSPPPFTSHSPPSHMSVAFLIGGVSKRPPSSKAS
jgi:trafficking protein particle complex subunit 10